VHIRHLQEYTKTTNKNTHQNTTTIHKKTNNNTQRQLLQCTQDNYNNVHKTTNNITRKTTTTLHTRQLTTIHNRYFKIHVQKVNNTKVRKYCIQFLVSFFPHIIYSSGCWFFGSAIIRITLTLPLNLPSVLQKINCLDITTYRIKYSTVLWLLEMQISRRWKVQTQIRSVNSDSWTANWHFCLFSKKNSIILIFYPSGRLAVSINRGKWSTIVFKSAMERVGWNMAEGDNTCLVERGGHSGTYCSTLILLL